MSEENYYVTLEIVARIDHEVTKGIRHYRTKAGELLTTLDQVINAFLGDNLLLNE